MINNVHYSKDLEEAIIGACLLEQTGFGRTYGLVTEDDFYHDDYKSVFSCMAQMFDNSLPIDMITVAVLMGEKGIKVTYPNIPALLCKITTNVVSTAHLEYHCFLLKNMWRKREIEKLTNSGADHTADARDQIQYINDQILNIEGNQIKKEWHTMDELMYELIRHQDEIKAGNKQFITSAFKAIDKENGGFAAGNLVIIGARPSVGKSALMGKMAMTIAKSGKKVGIVSLEMNNVEIAARLSSLETDIEFYRIYRNLFEDERQGQRFYEIVSTDLARLPIYVSDKTKVDLNEIKAKAAKLKRSHGLDCLMIDYLQLVGGSAETRNFNREQEVARISRGLKLLAMDMQIPVVVLCQLNRQSTLRKGTGRYPQLSDLRESGSLEQDADVVMMLHRDWLLEGFQADANGNSTEFKADLLVQKWRNGATCHLELEFEPKKMKFKEQHVFTHVPRQITEEDDPFPPFKN